MSYQVLARKWRPRNFRQMVGQEHVLQALTNALDNDRLHHAYLFTGTRGVGKTTIARILAKSLNCEKGVTSAPCGECSACKEIDEGRFVDLIEVDAASRTKVDETRELLDNVQYTPTRGRYKVYLIDEVHMFSGHSFNALLKTLEEPPPHVKFLLATTDPKKLPVTILSRCLQFNLRRLSPALIAGQLKHILDEENISAEAEALDELARAADGSMRDGLSLLDQSIAYGGGAVRTAEVRTMLGSMERGQVIELLRALARGDAQEVLALVQGLDQHAPDYADALAEILSVLQRIAVAQVLPGGEGDESADILQLSKSMTAEDVQLFYQIGLTGRRDLPLAPDARGGFEMVLLRMLAFRPAAVEAGTETASAKPAVKPPQADPAARSAAAPASRAAPAASAGASDWAQIIDALDLKGMARELAANCVLVGREGDVVRLQLDTTHAQLRRDNLVQRLQEALRGHYGAPVKLVFEDAVSDVETPAQKQARLLRERQERAVNAIEQDATVKALQETFDATLQRETIRPLD